MTKLDPIIAVRDVEASSRWYESVFGCRRAHGGEGNFAVMLMENGEVLICLHKWGAHDHPTMTNTSVPPGNGLILYFRTENMNAIRENVRAMGYPVEEDVQMNPNSRKMEFSLRDPDGYWLTVSEFHTYDG